MTLPVNTKGAARILGVPPGTLYRAVWDERLDPPPRGVSGTFEWGREDLRRASWALLHREWDEAAADREEVVR